MPVARTYLAFLTFSPPLYYNNNHAKPINMDDSEDFEIDPAIAAAMGFSGFGAQKKRKFDADQGFVDPSFKQAQMAESSTGANSAPLGQKKAVKVEHVPKEAVQAAPAKPSLEALRHGVRNERGDMVYFMPSFLEDPWAGLKAQ